MLKSSRHFSGISQKILVLILSALMLLTQVASTWARPPVPPPSGPPPAVAHPGPPRPGGPPGPPIPFGMEFPALPVGYIAVMLAGALFYYHAGNYYKQSPTGYVVVEAPPGAVIQALPAGYQTVVVNGITYFTFGGVYYIQVPNGYKVVAAPTPQPNATPMAVAGTVVVTAKVLNVRSGPGLQHQIIASVRQGNRLQVIGNERDWYYVQLPGGIQGWVKAQFTTKLVEPAAG